MAKVIGYIRASKDEQKLTPDAQRFEMERWCAAAGHELVAVEVDYLSGATPVEDRPGFIAVLEGIERHGAEVILVLRRDRLAREVVIAAVAEKLAQSAGARIETVSGAGNGDTPEDQLLRTMLDAIAQYERALIRARTKAALAVKRRKGQVYGRVPFGFRREGDRLVEDRAQRDAATYAVSLHYDGMSYAGIARTLNAENRPTPRGGRWHATTVRRLVKVVEHTPA